MGMEMVLEDEEKTISDEELQLKRMEMEQEHEEDEKGDEEPALKGMEMEHAHKEEEKGDAEHALKKTDLEEEVKGNDELTLKKTEMEQERQEEEVKKVRLGPRSNTKESNKIVLGIIIPIIIILLVGLAVYLFLKRRRAKAMGISMRFRNPSFAIGPEELKSVEVVGGKTAAAGVSTSTPSLGPRSYTMESSKSG